MSIVAHCASCGARFTLSDSMAGRKARCARCKSVIQIPELVDAEPDDLFSLADEDSRSAPPVVSASPAGPVVLDHAAREEERARQDQLPDRLTTDPTRGFWADAALSFAVPFHGRGVFVLIMVLILRIIHQFLAFASYAGCAGQIIGLLGRFIIDGWLFALYLNTIGETCRGEDELPNIGMDQGAIDDVILPFFRFVGGFAWVWLPFGVCGILMWRFGGFVDPMSDWLLLLGLWGLGLFMWPMTVLTIAVYGFALDALRYDLQVVTIARAFVQYLAIWVLLSFTIGAYFAMTFGSILSQYFPNALGWLPTGMVGTIVFFGVQSYFMLVSMRIIGLFYRHNKRHFAWVAE